MSSRVLKKLHGDNDLEVPEQDVSDLDNDNSFISNSGARKKQFDGNRYDLVIFHSFSLVLNSEPSFVFLHDAYEHASAVIVVVFIIVVQYLLCA